MKILFLFLSIFLGTTQDEVIADIGTAMKAGSAKELIKFANSTVEIKMEGESSNYSKSQAEVILRNFFDKNSPTGFSYIHKGSSAEGLMYTIGKYTYKEGSYRVVMLIKKSNGNFLIDTLQFIKE